MEVLSSPSGNESSGIIIPPHSDRMVWSILCTVFCCLVGGIIAIVYAAESNKLYSSAMFASDDDLKQALYLQSEQKNGVARTWIIVSLAWASLGAIVFFILIAAGVLSEYL